MPSAEAAEAEEPRWPLTSQPRSPPPVSLYSSALTQAPPAQRLPAAHCSPLVQVE